MLLAIVPAYNEAKRIEDVIKKLQDHVDEVVVVDDCSSDSTVEVAQKAGATVVTHKINLGQGAALETGHAYARKVGAEYVLHFDGDGQFDVADISPALAMLKEQKLDVVLGSRFMQKKGNVPPMKRYVIHPLARVFNFLITGLWLTDAHNGFRILNKKALNAIHIQQNRMAHASEILALVKKNNLTVAEVPITVTYHEYGQRGSAAFVIVRDLILGKFVK